MNSSNSTSVDEWDSWLDSWAGFWIEGVALPVIAAFGIVGEDKTLDVQHFLYETLPICV